MSQKPPPNTAPKSSSKPPTISKESSGSKTPPPTTKTEPKLVQPDHPAKFRVSKKDFLAQLFTVVAIFVIGFAKLIYDSNRPQQQQQKPAKKPNAAQLQNQLEELMEILTKDEADVPPVVPVGDGVGIGSGTTATGKRNKNKGEEGEEQNCRLYLARSSIKGGSNLGIFAAVPFEPGEIVFPSLDSSLSLSSSSSSSSSSPPPILAYLRHHHLFANVQLGSSSSSSSSSVLASRRIEGGEELFFLRTDLAAVTTTTTTNNNNNNLLNQYDRLNPDLPTPETFHKIDDIIQSLLSSIPDITTPKQTSKNYRNVHKQQQKETLIVHPVMDSTPLLRTMQRVLQSYDPVVARLFPVTNGVARSMLRMEGGSASYLSHKRDVEWVREYGACVDGLLLEGTGDGGTGGGKGETKMVTTKATRNWNEGEVVTTAPVVLRKKSPGGKSSSHNEEGMTKKCFETEEDVGFVVCPMSSAAFIGHGYSTGECKGGEGKGECINGGDDGDANVYYQWSEFNSFNKQLDGIVLEDWINKATGLTIDYIANRDIQKGEEIRFDYLAKTVSNVESTPRLKDDMIPLEWKDSPTSR